MPIETRRILLIHTDDAIAEMMLLCLETIPDSEVITVDSGLEGIENASAADVILLDIDETMPDLCWREIVQNLKQNSSTNSIPLILLTATPQSQELLEFQQNEELKAIAKSFDLLNLVNQISLLLNWN
ncbi:MAG: response regulator [Pleurocapsa sp. SU_5_0]|nr:response regulator [Pleurocapsa sp. SU_5_0]NJO96825.1 response regulator [Pleurocapsa sp. CRU_1_2]NJR46400.1 response regulator [Hyellaceae cyanobacterium CSU_1_1]